LDKYGEASQPFSVLRFFQKNADGNGAGRAEFPLVNRGGGIYTSAMAYEFKAIRRVEFSDTDMAGIMHYANYFHFMETAENAFFRSLGFCIVGNPGLPVSWPRVRAECNYWAPLYFEDEVEIHLLVSGKKSKALTYLFKFRKLNAAPPLEVARGHLTVVCVTVDGGKMAACAMPEVMSDKIQVAPAELLR
jgi:YbgC/YbaW family acyl-CoA thioester hydrolase